MKKKLLDIKNFKAPLTFSRENVTADLDKVMGNTGICLAVSVFAIALVVKSY